MTESKELLRERIFFVRENLPFRVVFAHYNLPWKMDGTHQLSCAFHGEDKNPSARYYADTKRFHCFACTEDQGGDVVWFVKKMGGFCSIEATLEFIASAFKVSMDPMDLNKRIALRDQVRSFPPRQLFAKTYKDKVNDVIFRIKRDPRILPGDLARLESYIWESWAGIEEAVEPQYLVFCDSVRMWYQECVLMIRDFLTLKGLLKVKEPV